MKATRTPRSILVPVFDGDISEAVLIRGRSMLVASDARFVFVHIMPAPEPGSVGVRALSHLRVNRPLRWRQLASAAHPGRVFVEALQGDPETIIAVEAERFHSDAILFDGSLDTPASTPTGCAAPSATPPQEAGC